jgi:hypothetical protein
MPDQLVVVQDDSLRKRLEKLEADNLELRADIQHRSTLEFKLLNDLETVRAQREDLQRRLALAESKRADAEKALREIQRIPEEPPVDILGDEDLPDLPDAYIQLIREALERFAEGYAEYGPGAADDEGLAGQWGDMKRKIMKLRPVFWSGEDRLTRETPQEVLQDIIGHALLALEMLERGFEGGRS